MTHCSNEKAHSDILQINIFVWLTVPASLYLCSVIFSELLAGRISNQIPGILRAWQPACSAAIVYSLEVNQPYSYQQH